MTAREALRAIQEFVELAVQRRVGSLPPEQRARADALDERLRDLIDGAKPRPRSIENPSPARSLLGARDSDVLSSAVAPKNLKLGGLSQQLDKALDSREKKKIRDVSTADLPRSFYTPSSTPAYLSDYYDDDLVPTATLDLGGALPKAVVRADGESMELMDEVKVLFGLAEAPPPRAPVVEREPERPGEREPERDSSQPITSPQLGRPTIVHFVSGGTMRGEIAPFEPHTGQIVFLGKDGSTQVIHLRDVLAVFFGLLKGEPPTDPTGERMIITLINDKRVVGTTDDYQEGGDSLTLVPDPRRGNIDRIWIPASAVKALELE